MGDLQPWQGWKITLCSAGKVLELMHHELPLEVIPFPDLHNCSSSQLHLQLNHLPGKARAEPPLLGMAQLYSYPCAGSACAGTARRRQPHQCLPLQHPPSPRRPGAAESPKLCHCLTQPQAAARSLSLSAQMAAAPVPDPSAISPPAPSPAPVPVPSAVPPPVLIHTRVTAGPVPACPCSAVGQGL